MVDGSAKPIRDVKVGDKVKSADAWSGKSSVRKVVATMKHAAAATVMVAVTFASGGTAHASVEHPFMVPDAASAGALQVEAEDLRVGDLVRTGDGTVTTVVQIREYTSPAMVHNLTVEGDHTYFIAVADGEVWTHNCGPSDSGSSQLNARDADSGASPNAASTSAAAPRGGVYVLRDDAGNVVRTGRSKDLKRREGEHNSDPELKGFTFKAVHKTDD